MPETIQSKSTAVVDPPKPPSGMIAAMRATLSGESAPAAADAPASTEAPKTDTATQDKPNLEVVGRDRKGRFIDSGSTQDDSPPVSAPKSDAVPAKPEAESVGLKNLRQQLEKTKSEYKTAQDELASLRGQLNPEEYKAAKEELERLKAEKGELLDALKAADFTRHPEYKREVEAPLKAAEARLLQYVPDNLKGQIRYLADQPPSAQRLSAIEQAVSELSPIAQSAIVNAVESYSDAITRRNAVLENGKQFAEQYEQKRAQDAQRRQQEARTAFDRHIADALTAAADEIPMFKERSGDDTWNKEVVARRAAVQHLLTAETDPSRLAEAAVFAEVGRKTLGLLPKAQAEIARLQAELDSLKSNRPGVPKQATATQGTDKPKTFVEAMKAALAGSPN